MFDYVCCEVPLPDGYKGPFQTKDLDRLLDTVLIRADGRLLIEEFDMEVVPLEDRPNPKMPLFGAHRAVNKRWRDLNFHGDISFYGSEGAGDWHEYIARFSHGELVGIVSHPAPRSQPHNVLAERKRASHIETDLFNGFASEGQDKVTLGRALDDLIAELPEDRRRLIEKRVSAIIAEEAARSGRNDVRASDLDF